MEVGFVSALVTGVETDRFTETLHENGHGKREAVDGDVGPG